MSPSPTTRHQRVAFVLGMVLERQLPAGLVVVLDTDVVLDPGKDQNVLRPDVYVANREAVRDLQQGALAVSNCLLVVEIESPSTAEYDRSTKARKYAGAGVSNFWRVEFISPGWDRSAVVIAHTLEHGTYRETAHVTAGHLFESHVPFDLSFDPAVLTD